MTLRICGLGESTGRGVDSTSQVRGESQNGPKILTRQPRIRPPLRANSRERATGHGENLVGRCDSEAPDVDHAGDIGAGDSLLVGRHRQRVDPILKLSTASFAEFGDLFPVTHLADSHDRIASTR